MTKSVFLHSSHIKRIALIEKTSNNVRIENKRMKRLHEKPVTENATIFYCSVMSAILSKLFASLDSLVLSYQEESTFNINLL